MKKLFSIMLVSSLLVSLISLPVQSVSAQQVGNQSTSESVKSSNMVNMSEETKKIADLYVKVKDNLFVIENQEELKDKIGSDQFIEVKKQVQFTNEQLSQADLSKAKTVNNTVQVDIESKGNNDGMFAIASKEGIDKIEFHWTYATVWLSKSTAEKTIKVGAGALGTALGGIGGKLAAAVAGSIIGGSISEFFAGSVAKAVKFNIALVPPFHTWNIRNQ